MLDLRSPCQPRREPIDLLLSQSGRRGRIRRRIRPPSRVAGLECTTAPAVLLPTNYETGAKAVNGRAGQKSLFKKYETSKGFSGWMLRPKSISPPSPVSVELIQSFPLCVVKRKRGSFSGNLRIDRSRDFASRPSPGLALLVVTFCRKFRLIYLEVQPLQTLDASDELRFRRADRSRQRHLLDLVFGSHSSGAIAYAFDVCAFHCAMELRSWNRRPARRRAAAFRRSAPGAAKSSTLRAGARPALASMRK
jgi:hypothetical protein